MTSTKLQCGGALCAAVIALQGLSTPLRATEIARTWEFNTIGEREGWSVPERLTGVVMGGSLWLTPTPKEKDPKVIAGINYQITGDWNFMFRIGDKERTGALASGHLTVEGPASVDIVSPANLDIPAPTSVHEQLQLQARILNLSPATDLFFKWRSKDMEAGDWQMTRCALEPDLKQWQTVTCFVGRPWRGEVDQIALGVSENVIRGDLWIDSLKMGAGPVAPVPPRPDLVSEPIVPKISVPGLSQTAFADAFKVLDEGLVVDVPAYGFRYPYIRASGDNKYGDYWWELDTSLNAAAAAWVNQGFAENVMRGFHEVQGFNPDGRLSGSQHQPTSGQPGDFSQPQPYFFESAYAIAIRSEDSALRREIYETMKRLLDWYLSPIKRNAQTGLVTGAFEEAGDTIYEKDIWGYAYPQTRAPVQLNTAIAVAATLSAELAETIGISGDALRYRQVADELRNSINTFLWDKQEHAYRDYNVQTATFFRMPPGAPGIDPLRLGIAPKRRQGVLVKALLESLDLDLEGRVHRTSPKVSLDGQNREWEQLSNMHSEAGYRPAVQGLEDTGHAELAASLNWAALKTFQGVYDEWISPLPEVAAPAGKRYGAWAAATHITGVIEHLFGLRFDAVRKVIVVRAYVPKALYGQDIALDNVVVPGEVVTRLAVRINQKSPTRAQIQVALRGPLPAAVFEVSLPDSEKVFRVPAQHSLAFRFP